VARGDGLTDLNVLDFFTNTYEGDVAKSAPFDSVEDGTGHKRRRKGRPSHLRVEYLETHPRHNKKVRIVRGGNNRTLPNIIGRWFPRRDPGLPQHVYYCASMLMLLKPWRSIDDLRGAGESWEVAFATFLRDASPRLKRILSGIEYFHQCRDAADSHSEGRHVSSGTLEPKEQVNPQERGGQVALGIFEDAEPALTPQQIEEDWHGRLAVEIARLLKIFDPPSQSWTVSDNERIRLADDMNYQCLVDGGIKCRMTSWLET
jgi:hypothetical protein